MNTLPLDLLPLWLYLPLVMAISWLTLEAGYRLGRWRHAQAPEEKDAPVAAMAGAVLGLLAFMLAFTFGMAASRFDARRQAVLEEAHALHTTYLRARLLAEPERSKLADLLRRYTQLRAQSPNSSNIAQLLAESEILQKQLWAQAIMVAEKDPNSAVTELFLESLNEVINLHSKRVFVGLYSRIPTTLWLALLALTLLGMFTFGYQAGIAATRRSLGMPIFTLAFASVLYLIIDLDRAHEGLMTVSQRAIIDLSHAMQDDAPP